MDVIQYSVRVSFLELYNEEVRDLLNDDESLVSLNMFNDSKGSVYIQGLSDIAVRNSSEIYALLVKGTSRRQTACTLLNNHSSRSHTVFTIAVHIIESNITGEEVLKTGKINLVDLAGSENIAKSGAKDKRAVELGNINKSLLTLGRVIQSLAEKHKHIPYRESKLTRILQDSLGGHTKTCIIATISPSQNSYDETSNTLEYACRVRNIKNTPTINEKVTKVRMIKDMTDEIDKLKKDLEAARSGEGFFIDKENWEQINLERESASNAITLKCQVIEDLKNRISEFQSACSMKAAEFDKIMKECRKRQKIIDKAKKLLKEKNKDLKEKQYVSEYYEKVAIERETQANDLLKTIQHLSDNQTTLQQKLEKQYYNNYSNEQIVKQKTKNLTLNLTAIKEEEDYLKFRLTDFANTLRELEHLQEITANAISQKICWENDTAPSLLVNLDEYDNIGEQIIEQSNFLTDTVESSVEKVLLSIGSIKDKSKKLLEQFNSYEMKESQESESMIQQLQTVKSSLLHERDQHLTELRIQKIITDIIQSKINDIDSLLDKVDCSITQTSPVDILDQKASQFKQDILEFQERFTALEENLACLKLELEDSKLCINELQQQMLPKIQYLKHQVVEQVDDLKGILTDLSNNVNSVIATTATSCRIQKEAIPTHVEKCSSFLENCDDIVTDIVKNIVPVQRAGDTPKQCHLEYPKTITKGALPREVLLNKFKDEFDDVENPSFNLDCSTDSLSNF
ncbi:kinesin-like protein KIF11 isoform X2 [Cylas formicarius]|nr:kinesin-like protein KIF11 isoform X2 [Cylas formicarius]